jgi:general nucleoside transport system permease protein
VSAAVVILAQGGAARLLLGAAVGGAFVAVLLGLLALTGRDPFTVGWTLVSYGFLDPNGRAEMVVRAIPLCLMGLGVAIAFRAGAFNIGADGQLIAGSALAMAAVPVLVGLPAWIGIGGFILVAAVGGGAWGGVAGWMRARFGANEIIVTIMLNYVALQLLSWLIRGPMQERMGMLPRTDALPAALRLPIVFDGTRIHAGVWIALAATVVLALVLRRTIFGYRLDMVGRNPDAARVGGIGDRAVLVAAMLIGGALCGIAGAIEIAGLHFRLQEGIAVGYGITAIAIALLARKQPLAVPFAALALAALYVGGAAVQRQYAVPFPTVKMVEGLIVFAFLAFTALRRSGGRGA